MKKIILTAGLVIFTVTLCLANTIVVDCNGGGDYYTIQAGIDNAQDGDEVFVCEGTYYEQVVIPDKEIYIHGLADEIGPKVTIKWLAGHVIVSDNTTAEWIFSSFLIEQLNIQKHGIKLTNVQNAQLAGIVVKGKYKTLHGYWSNYVEKGGGFYIYNCNDIVIYTTLYQCRARYGGGIYCENSNITELEINYSVDGGALKGGTLYAKNSVIYNFQGATDYFSSGGEWFYPSESYWDGGFIYADNSNIYVGNIEYDKNNRDYYDDYGLYCYGCEVYYSGSGGAITLKNGSYLSIDYESFFENNNCTIFGGAIFVEDSNLHINSYTEFKDNYSQVGGAILIWQNNTNLVPFCYLKNCVFEENEASSKGGAICGYNYQYGLFIENCVFIDNVSNLGDCISAEGLQYVKIKNSIFNEQNNYEYIYLDNNLSVEIAYCCLQYGEDNAIYGDASFQNNIEEDPLFNNPTNNDYSLKWDFNNFSPCIDTGDPDEQYNDPDGTPSDMGAIPAISHDYFINQYDGEVFDRIEWISFPALNRITNGYMDALNVLERQELIDDNPQTTDILDHVLFEAWNKIYFAGNSWHNDLGYFDSRQGYKFVLQEQYDDIPMKGISGTWEAESTPIQLFANKENWVGCYLQESASREEAFESISDEWTEIRSEHWAVERIPEEPTPHIRGTVNPGELYIIRVENDCQLIWNNSGGGVEPYIREKTDYFTYEETVDYMPITVDTVYSDTTVAEIAVYSDDQCIGASKVSDGYPVQILAYTPETLKNGNNGLEFMLLYEGQKRGSSKSIPYITYSKEAQAFIAQPLYYERNTFATVQLNTDEPSYTQQITLMQNYPNPVRTNTTQINFMPEQKAQHTELNIYNLKGQLVRTIDCDRIISYGAKNGYYSLTWDCRDRNGKDVKNGIYFYKLTSGEKSAVHKMLIMK